MLLTCVTSVSALPVCACACLACLCAHAGPALKLHKPPLHAKPPPAGAAAGHGDEQLRQPLTFLLPSTHGAADGQAGSQHKREDMRWPLARALCALMHHACCMQRARCWICNAGKLIVRSLPLTLPRHSCLLAVRHAPHVLAVRGAWGWTRSAQAGLQRMAAACWLRAGAGDGQLLAVWRAQKVPEAVPP